MDAILALVDCNNFYVSCERAFNAAIHHMPVIVLSNNDGCVVARSNEAKALGIKMGTRIFQCQDLVEQHHIVLFSSNYALYADLSDRVMASLNPLSSHVEVYSIDEAFVDLSHVEPACVQAYGQQIRARVLQYTGIPVSVGIAPSKTLTKIATELVKKYPEYQGVLTLAFRLINSAVCLIYSSRYSNYEAMISRRLLRQLNNSCQPCASDARCLFIS